MQLTTCLYEAESWALCYPGMRQAAWTCSLPGFRTTETLEFADAPFESWPPCFPWSPRRTQPDLRRDRKRAAAGRAKGTGSPHRNESVCWHLAAWGGWERQCERPTPCCSASRPMPAERGGQQPPRIPESYLHVAFPSQSAHQAFPSQVKPLMNSVHDGLD